MRDEKIDELVPAQSRVHELYRIYEKLSDPLGCFDALYAESRGEIQKIPWAKQRPNPSLVNWAAAKKSQEDGWTRRALVVGCGLGDDAEYLTSQGWKVMAFDLSPHAIEWARRRFPDSPAHYFQADLFRLPAVFYQVFDLVFESSTVQAIPLRLRAKAISSIANTVAPGGKLMVVTRAREEDEALANMPWPLSRGELDLFAKGGLRQTALVDRFVTDRQSPIRIFQAEYLRERR